MRKGDEGSRNDLPGFEGVQGRKADETLPHTKPKPRLVPVNRNQMRIVPVDVERLIGEEHEARAIWDFVGRLDLASSYEEIGSVEGEGGRPAYDPQVLMSVWIYGYSKGIGSAREIARRNGVRSRIPVDRRHGDYQLSHPLGLSHFPQRIP